MTKTSTASAEQVSGGSCDPGYVSVITRVNGADVIIDTRICDIHDFKARRWLSNHHCWAFFQGHSVEVHPATPVEVTDYTAKQALALSRRFGR